MPTLFPGVDSLGSAQQIVLLPGDRRADVDLHLSEAQVFSLEGIIVFRDRSKPKPWPEATYFQDLVAFRSDRGVTSTSLGPEACEIDANRGKFRCDSLLPGEYTLYFQVSAGLGGASDLPTQAANVRYRVSAAKGQQLRVQLQDASGHEQVFQQPFQGPGGRIDFAKVCIPASDSNSAVRIMASGSGYAVANCYLSRFGGTASVLLPQATTRWLRLKRPFSTGLLGVAQNSRRPSRRMAH